MFLVLPIDLLCLSRSKRDLETSGGQDYSGTTNQQYFNRQYFVSQCKAHYSTAVAVITHL